ncbi:MAG: bifunctional tetrahydrofolate synthase/dihydrofolate synthase [Pseudohongiellaceae bacterium]
MITSPDAADSLADWLDYIDQVHPLKIELGLDRVRAVMTRMQLLPVAPLVVTVAGTNGKGSCVAGIDLGLRRHGLHTGVYTSPHIEHFNERIHLGEQEASDGDICAALAAVERARGETSLSYFEFATLAAFKLFHDARLDAVVLEVGLGGRLDAVNLLDADVAVIASISIDHTAWLGADRESIGFEKAGIARPGRPLVYGDRDIPASIERHAAALGTPLYRLGREYDIRAEADNVRWRGLDAQGQPLDAGPFTPGEQIPDNLATILQALTLLDVPPDPGLLAALASLCLPGRFEWRRVAGCRARILFDVAHNPGGMRLLGERLAARQTTAAAGSRLIAVLAIMADKELESMTAALQSQVDIWYIAQVDEPRCMPAQEVTQRLRRQGGRAPVRQYDSVAEAFREACAQSGAGDLIVVTGSFHTVSAVRHLTEAPAAGNSAAQS